MNAPLPAAAMLALPLYRCFKTVRAAKIDAIRQAPAGQKAQHASGDWLLDVVGGNLSHPHTITVGHNYIAKHQPQPGGYLVIYEDNYMSYSPAEAFEAGYVPSSAFGLTREQEPKYTFGAGGRLINRVTEKPIPDDEPVMIFRAQDRKAVLALHAYLHVVSNPAHQAVVRQRIEQFDAFAEAHPERMKEPDTAEDPAARAEIPQASFL